MDLSELISDDCQNCLLCNYYLRFRMYSKQFHFSMYSGQPVSGRDEDSRF